MIGEGNSWDAAIDLTDDTPTEGSLPRRQRMLENDMKEESKSRIIVSDLTDDDSPSLTLPRPHATRNTTMDNIRAISPIEELWEEDWLSDEDQSPPTPRSPKSKDKKTLPSYPRKCKEYLPKSSAFWLILLQQSYGDLLPYAPEALPLDHIDPQKGQTIYDAYETHKDGTLTGECIIAHGSNGNPKLVAVSRCLHFPCENPDCEYGGEHELKTHIQATWCALLIAGKINLKTWKAILDGKLEASHLCGNASCMEPAHMVLESCSANQSRKVCHAANYCIKKHKPSCIVGVQLVNPIIAQQLYTQRTKDRDSKVPLCPYASKGCMWKNHIKLNQILRLSRARSVHMTICKFHKALRKGQKGAKQKLCA